MGRSARTSGRIASLVAALTVSVVSAAYAHGALRASVPARGSHLAAAPRELRLTFTEVPQLAVTTIELLAPGGMPVALDRLRAVTDSPQVIVARIAGPLVAGPYTVRWKIAGRDGHPVRDRFTFTIARGATGLGVSGGSLRASRAEPAGGAGASGDTMPDTHQDPVTTPESESGFDASSPLYALIRWLAFGSLLIVLGAVAFQYVVLGRARWSSARTSSISAVASVRAASIGLWAGIALAVSTLLRLIAQSYALHGAEDALNPELISTMLARTIWGWGWLLQLVAIVVAILSFRAARRGTAAAWGAAALAAVVLCVTPALSGHASSAPGLTALAVIADSAHVLGAAGWLGSLFLVTAAGIPAALRLPEGERASGVADVVHAFSPAALVFASIVALTGIFAAWVHVGTLSGLWQSTYGRRLLIKLGFVGIAALTGAYNWLRAKPALGSATGTRRIRRSASVELAAAVLVLAVTAVLVATPTTLDERMESPMMHE